MRFVRSSIAGAVILAAVTTACGAAAPVSTAAASPALPETAPATAAPVVETAAPEVETAAARPAARGTSNEILEEHNRVRKLHCAPALAWSDKLAAVAQRWANKLRERGCAFEHSESQYGENLAAGSTGSLPPKAVVAMWVEEEKDYDYRRSRFSPGTGHFTQVVWRGSTELGCGMSQCNGMDVWVCNYAPAGNMEGDFAANVRPEGCR